jgi:hypothetical protein
VTLTGAAVPRPGDLVHYDGADHQVIALAGTSVWLRSEHGAESVVLLAYQMASPEFAVIDGAGSPRARWQLVRVHELAKRLRWTPQTSGFLRALGTFGLSSLSRQIHQRPPTMCSIPTCW